MAVEKKRRINQVLREFNISLDRAVEFLSSKGFDVEASPNTKISKEEYELLYEEFETDKSKRQESIEVGEEKRKEKEELRLELEREQEKQKKESSRVIRAEVKLAGPKQVGKIDLDAPKKQTPEKPAEEKPQVAKKETPEVKPKPEAEPVKEEKQKETAPTAEKKVEEKPKKVVEPVQEVKKETPKTEKQQPVVPSKPKEKSEAPKKKSEAPKTPSKEQSKKTVESPKPAKEPEVKAEEATHENTSITTEYRKLEGPSFTGQKIDLSKFDKPEKKKETKDPKKDKRGKRRRISKDVKPAASGGNRPQRGRGRKPVQAPREEPSEEEVQKQIRETLEKLQGKASRGRAARYRKEKREFHRQKTEDELAQQELESKLLKVTEFVTVSEVATMMDVPVTKVDRKSVV